MSGVNSHVPHILELTKTAKRDFFSSFDFIFFDCDGVLWLVLESIPHSDDAMNLLWNTDKKCKFVSNNSARSNAGYLEKFKNMGLHDVRDDDIIHPAKSIISYVQTYLPPDATFFSICDKNANELFRESGLNVKTLEVREHLTSSTFVDAVHLRGESVNAVLCDINKNLHFSQITRAILYLQQNEECELIIGGADNTFPLTADLNSVGWGEIVDILKKQTNREPIHLGKPGRALGNMIKKKFNITDPKRILFVGDNLKQDIFFGKQCGFQTLLVLTGVTSREDMLTAPSEYCPDFYANGIVDFIEFLKDL